MSGERERDRERERERERVRGRQRTERRREKDLGCLWIRKEKDDKRDILTAYRIR